MKGENHDLAPVEPDARERVDRIRILTGVVLEKSDETRPNFVLLLILAEQLHRLRDILKAAEYRLMQEDWLSL